ncbi:MAG: ribonuclease J, partial [Firmicutes bacterium]|nr:ribonuclease J [Bacillota bacterium]
MAEKKTKNTKTKDTETENTKKLRIMPVGGLHEIGKNMTLFECGDDIIIADCGMSFPDSEMLGIDVVIPDFTYVIENSDRVRGLIITHAHEDHIGGVPYLLQKLDVPIYASRLTLGFIKHKLEEHKIEADLHEIKAGQSFRLGCFKIETLHMTHSVADALGFAIDTPVGKVIFTGDFKVDYTPVDGQRIDFNRLSQLGSDGVLLLMADSTNAVRHGFTPSETEVGISLGNIFRGTHSRIIIATFSSNVHRVQKIMELAKENGRKIAVSGRSMENMVKIATELGYLKVPAGTLIDLKATKNYKDNEIVILTTGSQGEPMSALTRMARDEHKDIKIRNNDVIIFSSSPVPGNERAVTSVLNLLMEKGARVIYNDIADTHVSGHAC